MKDQPQQHRRKSSGKPGEVPVSLVQLNAISIRISMVSDFPKGSVIKDKG